MVEYQGILGTHENRNQYDWTEANSHLASFLEGQGLVNLAKRVQPAFDWTTNLDTSAKDDYNWRTGGLNLFEYDVPPFAPERCWPPPSTVIVSHSHGLQVVLHAAALGLKIDRFLDFMGPVRSDMMDVARRARPNIRRWIHVHSDHTDRWQWLGELGDKHFGIVRAHPLADQNISLPGVGHSKMLYDPTYFHYWQDAKLTDFLKGTYDPTVANHPDGQR